MVSDENRKAHAELLLLFRVYDSKCINAQIHSRQSTEKRESLHF